MGYKIITISSQFGSGGRTIGREVAAKLGIPCYDHEIIDRLEEESGFAREYIAEKGEYASHGSIFANGIASGKNALHTASNQDYLWVLQKNIITDIASKGPCVIVGRCADYILADQHDCLRVFVHASMENRAHRIVEMYGARKESPKKRLKKKDRQRKAYYKYYTETQWGIAKNYHIALDSGELGIEKCVDIIAAVYNHK